MTATIPEWSDTAASNANLSGIPMYEGMLPAQLNDSVRAIMAEIHRAYSSVETGITASVTHTLVGARALTAHWNFVTVAAGAADAVSLLPAIAAVAGQHQYIFNSGASSIAVWPGAVADTIDGGGAGASVPLAAGKRCLYIQRASGIWVSAQLGVVSA